MLLEAKCAGLVVSHILMAIVSVIGAAILEHDAVSNRVIILWRALSGVTFKIASHCGATLGRFRMLSFVTTAFNGHTIRWVKVYSARCFDEACKKEMPQRKQMLPSCIHHQCFNVSCFKLYGLDGIVSAITNFIIRIYSSNIQNWK